MVDFINEVEEELRKDDYNRLLKKFGPAIGVVLFLIIAGAAFLEWREYSQGKTAQSVAAVYTAADTALEDGNLEGAVAQFVALGETGPDGYAGLSFMRAAAIRQGQDDIISAVTLFDQAAAKFDAPRHKHLAQLKAAYLLADQGAYSDVIARLDGLTEQDAPYEYLARELLGYAQQQSGNASAAREQFAFLTTIPGVPSSVKERASQSMALMNANSTMNAPQPILPDPTLETTQPTDTGDQTTEADATDDE